MLRRALLQRAASTLAASSSSQLVNRGSARRVAPLVVSPLLRKAPMVGSLLAAGSTGAACAFCSAAAAPASAIRSSTDVAWPRVTLYQYEPCPYCCKVKAVLDYLRIPYHVVEVNPLSKAETKAFTDYKKVPVLRLDDDEVVVDSSVIIARLRALAVERGVHQADASNDQSGVSLAEEEAWRKWVDEKLIILTPPNIYRTVPEALQSFEYALTEGKFTALERQLAKYSGAAIMYIVAKRAKKKYGIDDERAALYAALNAFVDAVGKERPFLGGAQPNTADLSVFGVLRAMEGLQTYDDLMQQSSIAPWFERMRAAVGPSTRVVESV